MDRARQSMLKNRELAAADPNRIAIELTEWGAQGDWRLYFLNRDRIEQVTPAQVKEVAAKYFTTSNRTVGFFVPTEQARANTDPGRPRHRQAGRRLHRPPAQSRVERNLRRLARWPSRPACNAPSRSAASSWPSCPRKTRGESVHLRLTLHYGDAENLKGLSEAAGFLPDLMIRGTKHLNRQQIQDALDKNFARLGTGMGMRMLRGLGGGARPGHGHLHDPDQARESSPPSSISSARSSASRAFPASEFEVMKNEQITGIEQGRSDPIPQGLNHIQRLLSQYPSDDVRYVADHRRTDRAHSRRSRSTRSARSITTISGPIMASWS